MLFRSEKDRELSQAWQQLQELREQFQKLQMTSEDKQLSFMQLQKARLAGTNPYTDTLGLTLHYQGLLCRGKTPFEHGWLVC